MGNNSGVERTVINTRERAVSTDINRLQQRNAQAYQELLARWASDAYTFDSAASANRGTEVVAVVDDDPLNADVFGGLKVRPFSTHLLVSPGSLAAKATPGTPDAGKDSDNVLVIDPGVTSSSVLTFTTNPGAGLRADVVECEIVDTILTTESRDIYDPLTGLFTAALVTKSASAQLNYRQRLGTPGAGFPGTAAGWLPLAVAVHQVGSSNFSDVDFFDVRPLVHDRTRPPTKYNVPNLFSKDEKMLQGVAKDETVFIIGGSYMFDTGGGPDVVPNKLGEYKLFGALAPTIPGKPTNTSIVRRRFELTDTDYFAQGVSTTAANRWLYVMSMQPYKLPRWCRYTEGAQASGEREPMENMGLMMIGDDPTNNIGDNGVCNLATLPTAYGLGASERARVVAIVREQSSGNQFLRSFVTRGGLMSWIDSLVIPVTGSLFSGGGSSTLTIDFALGIRAIGEIIPAFCSGFRCLISVNFDVATAVMKNGDFTAELNATSSTLQPPKHKSFAPFAIDTGYTINENFSFRIPSTLHPNPVDEDGGSLGSLTVRTTLGSGGSHTLTFTSATLWITEIHVGY